MTRQQLEHLIRAASVIADDDEIVVIGSQSILGLYPNAPATVLVSVEADLYSKHHPDRADLIDGTIGERLAEPHLERIAQRIASDFGQG
jgi:hypothetical protein